MTKYIVDWLGIAGENEVVFGTMDEALSFVKKIQWEAISEVIISAKDDERECLEGTGR